jgi:hypothetical protein
LGRGQHHPLSPLPWPNPGTPFPLSFGPTLPAPLLPEKPSVHARWPRTRAIMATDVSRTEPSPRLPPAASSSRVNALDTACIASPRLTRHHLVCQARAITPSPVGHDRYACLPPLAIKTTPAPSTPLSTLLHTHASSLPHCSAARAAAALRRHQ